MRYHDFIVSVPYLIIFVAMINNILAALERNLKVSEKPITHLEVNVNIKENLNIVGS